MDKLPGELDAYFAEKQLMIEKRKAKMKKGPNVVHLAYAGDQLSEQDLTEIENDLSAIGLEMSSFDKSGIPYNSFGISDMVIFLTGSTVGGLLQDFAKSAICDGLKAVIIKCAKKVRNKFTTQLTSGTVREREVSVSVKIKSADGKVLDFQISGISEEQISQAVDSIAALKDEEYPEGSLLLFDNGALIWKPASILQMREPQKYIREIPLDQYLKTLQQNQK